MILVGPISRLVLGRVGVSNLAIWITTPTVLDALGLGCLLAYLWCETKSADRVARWALILAALFIGLQEIMTLLGMSANAVFTISPRDWALLYMWLVHRAARGFRGWSSWLLRAAPLVYLGTISYGGYVIHLFVMSFVARLPHRLGLYLLVSDHPGRRQFVAVMLISVGVAALSWKFFERPINSLKDYFSYPSSTGR